MAGSFWGGGEAWIKQVLQGISHPPRSAYPPANHTKPVALTLPMNQTQNFRRPLLPAIFVCKAHATIHTINAKGRLKNAFQTTFMFEPAIVCGGRSIHDVGSTHEDN